MRAAALAALVALAPAAAGAQALHDCSHWATSAASVAEPWAEASRRFANGDIRLILLDTAEPACCSWFVLVQVPDPGTGYWGCAVLAATAEGLGFRGIDLQAARGAYDPRTGLDIAIPVTLHVTDLVTRPATATIRINRATGEVSAR